MRLTMKGKRLRGGLGGWARKADVYRCCAAFAALGLARAHPSMVLAVLATLVLAGSLAAGRAWTEARLWFGTIALVAMSLTLTSTTATGARLDHPVLVTSLAVAVSMAKGPGVLGCGALIALGAIIGGAGGSRLMESNPGTGPCFVLIVLAIAVRDLTSYGRRLVDSIRSSDGLWTYPAASGAAATVLLWNSGSRYVHHASDGTLILWVGCASLLSGGVSELLTADRSGRSGRAAPQRPGEADPGWVTEMNQTVATSALMFTILYVTLEDLVSPGEFYRGVPRIIDNDSPLGLYVVAIAAATLSAVTDTLMMICFAELSLDPTPEPS